MNRYIEIVYDNSGSMNENVGNNRKYEIAWPILVNPVFNSPLLFEWTS